VPNHFRVHHRVFLGALGFLVVLGAFEIAYLALGSPRAVGPILALVISTLIVLDPGDLLSEARSDR
jgi:hypothetical protein